MELMLNCFNFIYYTFEYIFELLYATIYGHGTNYLEESITKKFGLKVKVHTSTTKDGCVIKSYQILPKIQNENNQKLIFCQHGFFETGGTFIVFKNSLAIQLCELGYEVWIGHNRGSSFGQLTSHFNDEFWNYSIDDIIQYDLKCQIDKMFEITGQNKFAYVGQSQGGTQIMGFLNHYPEYLDNISFLTMIAPAIFVRKPKKLLINLLLSFPPNFYGKKEFFKLLHIGQKTVPSFIAKWTRNFIMFGLGLVNQNCAADSSIFKSVPEGCCSSKHAIHWFQNLSVGGRFQKFDFESFQENKYEKQKNSKKCYDIESLHKIPSLYILAKLDPVIDNELIVSEFENVHPIHLEEDFSHLDFTWCEEGCDILFDNFINYFKKSAKW